MKREIEEIVFEETPPQSLDTEFPEFDRMGQEEQRSDPVRLVEEFLSPKNIRGKTNLEPVEQQLFTLLHMMHRKYHARYGWDFDQLAEVYMHLKTSLKGEGKKGLLEMLKGRVEMSEQNIHTNANQVPRIPGVNIR